MIRYLLGIALRAITSAQIWYWEVIALGGAAALQRWRSRVVKILANRR